MKPYTDLRGNSVQYSPSFFSYFSSSFGGVLPRSFAYSIYLGYTYSVYFERCGKRDGKPRFLQPEIPCVVTALHPELRSSVPMCVIVKSFWLESLVLHATWGDYTTVTTNIRRSHLSVFRTLTPSFTDSYLHSRLRLPLISVRYRGYVLTIPATTEQGNVL